MAVGALSASGAVGEVLGGSCPLAMAAVVVPAPAERGAADG
jgi:hypothetical protein